MAVTDKQWLHHPETGGNFHCPTDAVDSWKSRGWVDGEEPKEVNPAVAEWQPHAPAIPEAPAEPEVAETKTKKARGTAVPATPEGVNDVG